MTKTGLANLQTRLQTALESYVKAFEKKHERVLEHVIGGDLMSGICFGDHFFSMADIVCDINNKLPKGMIYDWQNAMIEQRLKTPDAPVINLMHWHMAHGGKKR
jgi:hypothetical protein